MINRKQYVISVLSINDIIENPPWIQLYFNTHPFIPMRLICMVLGTFLTIKEEVSQAIKNGLSFVFFPTLRTMRMCAYNAIRSKINKIPISCNCFWQWYVNVFDTIVR